MKKYCVALTALLIVLTYRSAMTYSLFGYFWQTKTFGYYINPSNHDIGRRAARHALKSAATVWAPWCPGTYLGGTRTKHIANDGMNTVFFRRAANDNIIATTYTFYSGDQFIGFDIVFWDGGFQFYGSSKGCNKGFYVYDIGVHEFGHAIGLGHTTVENATMYPYFGSCTTSPRSLSKDDIAGVSRIY